jgi:hypothetical protein
MNHVPDAAVEAIDTFGKSRLFGNPEQVNEQLRDDLSIKIRQTRGSSTQMDNASIDASEDNCNKHAKSAQSSTTYIIYCRYETVHTHAPPTLRDRGSFVTTIVDAIDSRLRSWGIDPPTAYTYSNTIDGVHWYDGRLNPR